MSDNSRPFPSSIEFGTIQTRNCTYDSKYWTQLEALYAGGKDLLKDKDVLESVFPQQPYEQTDIYDRRKSRAIYISYPGEIIDHIVSHLTAKPIQVEVKNDSDGFYREFFEDVSPAGGNRMSLNHLLRKQVTKALVCKTAWTLLDFPPQQTAGAELASEAAQREAGILDGYAVAIDPKNVIDWEEDANGELVWAKLQYEERDRSFDGQSDEIRRTWIVYRLKDWAKYEIVFKVDNEPGADEPVPLIQSDDHSFGRVPLLRMEVPDGLWAMNKLDSIARAHLNHVSSLYWFMGLCLHPQLYEFLAEDTCLGGDISEDANRANSQPRGIGYTQVRAEKDDARFVGPDPAPFHAASAALKDLRDEMHRVTHQMALSFDNSASSLRRSGDSKSQDKRDSAVILNALGVLIHEFTIKLYETLSNGRGDKIEITISGMEDFDEAHFSSSVQEAAVLESVPIPSKTFHHRYKLNLAKAALGHTVDSESMAKISQELEANLPDTFEDKQQGEVQKQGTAQDSSSETDSTGDIE